MFEDRDTHIYICKADFKVTCVNRFEDPVTATYDA